MRFNEFSITESKKLFEYDSSMSDEELKDLIVSRLKSEEDRAMLDKIYQALEKSTLDERIKGALSVDEDAKSKLEIFAGMIMNTDGSYLEKNKFINDFSKGDGFIDVDRLLQRGQALEFESWIVGDDFVKRVFYNLFDYSPAGIGPGEYALAVLSPRIGASGRGSDAGDLLIDGSNMCEVKAIKGGAGRFYDGRKANMDQQSVKRAFEQIGINPGRAVSSSRWADKGMRDSIPKDKLEPLVDIILKGAFAYIKPEEWTRLKTALLRGTNKDIKREWGMLSYTNYKRMSKFDSMMILDVNKRHSLYFVDINTVADVINPGVPALYGPEQEVHPQITVKI